MSKTALPVHHSLWSFRGYSEVLWVALSTSFGQFACFWQIDPVGVKAINFNTTRRCHGCLNSLYLNYHCCYKADLFLFFACCIDFKITLEITVTMAHAAVCVITSLIPDTASRSQVLERRLTFRKPGYKITCFSQFFFFAIMWNINTKDKLLNDLNVSFK